MTNWQYRKGLHDLGSGIYAYLQPDGSWGWSNAGLIVDGEASMLVDTLFDLKLTAEMLAVMRDTTRAADRIDVLANTHANGDHCYGNELVGDAVIIASDAGAQEMEALPPDLMARFVANADQLGRGGRFLAKIFGDFDFEGIRHTPPTETFRGERICRVGDKQVHLIEVGPAHTRGDVLVHVPEDRVVFTGDILFIEGTPIMWEGPVANWIRACERIVDMDAEAIVPGHGPITDRRGVEAVKGYLEWIRDEARARFEAGMSARDAVRDISPGRYTSWSDAERIAVNVSTLYREFGDRAPAPNPVELFELMAELAGSD